MPLAEGDDRLGRFQPVGREAGDEDVRPLIGQRQMDVAAPLEPQPLEQRAKRGDQREQRGVKDMAFGHVDDGVALFLRKADQHAPALRLGMERCATAAVRGRAMRGAQRRGQALRVKRGGDAVGDEPGIAFVVQMLELAPAAAREMAAGRGLVMRAGHDGAVGRQGVAGCGKGGVAAGRGHAVAPGGDADDGIAHAISL